MTLSLIEVDDFVISYSNIIFKVVVCNYNYISGFVKDKNEPIAVIWDYEGNFVQGPAKFQDDIKMHITKETNPEYFI